MAPFLWVGVHHFLSNTFVEGGKLENPEKNPWNKDENQQQTQPTCDAGSVN